jgi:hypothetical protein
MNCSLYLDGSLNQTNPSAANGTQAAFLISGIADGGHNWSVQCADGAANANTSGTRAFTIDTINPSISMAAPASGSHLNTSYIAINASASDTNLKNITIYLYNSTGDLVNSSFTNASGSLFANFTGLPDGLYYFNATAYGNSGNMNKTETRNVTIDSRSPAIQFVLPTPNSSTYTMDTFIFANVSVADANPKSISLYLYDDFGVMGSKFTTMYAFLSGNFSDLPDGPYHLNATAYDRANNLNATETRNITVDTINPSSNVTAPPSGSYLNSSYIEINVTASDASPINITIELYNSTLGLANSSFTNTSDSLFANFTGLSDGLYYVNTTVFDAAGNLNASETINVTIDTINPAANVTAPPSGSYLNSSYIEINVTASDASPINITIELYNSTLGLANSSFTNTSDSLFANFTGLSDGLYYVNTTVFDAAGNLNASETINVTIDTINPAIQFSGTTPANDAYINTPYLEIGISSSDANPANITIYLYNSTGDLVNSSFTNASDSLFANFTGLDDIAYYFNATAYDAIGHSNSTETRNATIDTIPPAVNISSPGNVTGLSSPISVGFTAQDANQMECSYSIDNGANITIAGCANFSVSLGSGAHCLAVFANDSAGNLANGSVCFSISAEGHAAHKSSMEIAAEQAACNADNSSDVKITVRDLAGDPVRGADLDLHPAGLESSTDGNGTHVFGNLANGGYIAVAEKSGYFRATVSFTLNCSQPANATNQTGAQGAGQLLVSPFAYCDGLDGMAADITVADPNGTAVEGASVSIEGLEQAAITDSNGTASLMNLPPGLLFNVTASKNGYADGHSTFELDCAPRNLEIVAMTTCGSSKGEGATINVKAFLNSYPAVTAVNISGTATSGRAYAGGGRAGTQGLDAPYIDNGVYEISATMRNLNASQQVVVNCTYGYANKTKEGETGANATGTVNVTVGGPGIEDAVSRAVEAIASAATSPLAIATYAVVAISWFALIRRAKAAQARHGQ